MKEPSEAELNYGATDLVRSLTRHPYVRCNGQIPDVSKNHSVTVFNGDKEVKWDVYSLMRFTKTNFNVCMECAGNSRAKLGYATEGLQWDNRAVSNVTWSGVLVTSLLQRIPQDAQEIVFTSLDGGFTRSLPIRVIYERPVIVAYEMNNQELPLEHGYPIRLIVPGWYGMASVKWLDRISFTNKPFEGKYQTEKYTYQDDIGNKTPVTVTLPKSLITAIETQNPVVIRGKAWSGARIEKVEVCIDDTWVDAEIIERTGLYGWVTWEKRVVLSGKHRIACRATDATGATQPDTYSYNCFGYGNNAVQSMFYEA